MRIALSRDSVCMADDIDSHDCEIEARADLADIEKLLIEVSSGYLPSIAGGRATWVVYSRDPIAVMAQQWGTPKMLQESLQQGEKSGHLEINEKGLVLYFRYCTQQDPEEVWNKLSQDVSR